MSGSSHRKDHGMGFLDELKDKAEDFGDKAKEGFGAAKDKAEYVIENVKDRFDDDDTAGGRAGPESVGETAPVGATEPAAAAAEEAATEAQESTPSMGEPAAAAEPAAADVEEAGTAAQIVSDSKAGSESW
jgi:hypothetical protein